MVSKSVLPTKAPPRPLPPAPRVTFGVEGNVSFFASPNSPSTVFPVGQASRQPAATVSTSKINICSALAPWSRCRSMRQLSARTPADYPIFESSGDKRIWCRYRISSEIDQTGIETPRAWFHIISLFYSLAGCRFWPTISVIHLIN